jgi:hypothetical protein
MTAVAPLDVLMAWPLFNLYVPVTLPSRNTLVGLAI